MTKPSLPRPAPGQKDSDVDKNYRKKFDTHRLKFLVYGRLGLLSTGPFSRKTLRGTDPRFGIGLRGLSRLPQTNMCKGSESGKSFVGK
jgi:hypothetical protein